MCPCKKKSIIEYLEGFFEYVGSPQSGSTATYYNIYGNLLTSLYQLDDDGNKVVIDLDTASNKFVIDANKPVYVGAERDNSDSNYSAISGNNLYNDIVNLGFKPANHELLIDNVTLSSFILDAAKDSVLPISYNKSSGECTFSSNVRALCLPKVNFYIYKKYEMPHIPLPQFEGYYGIKRNGYETIGNYEYGLVYEDTGAIDEQGNVIQRAKASVLMLPTHNAANSGFKLLGHSDGNYGSNYDVDIETYSFDSSVDYGQEVDARGVYELVHVNFLNADSKHADLIPTDSCQLLGKITHREGSVSSEPMFGNKWGAKCNDIYCKSNGKLSITYNNKKNYMDRSVDSYIGGAFIIGIYNTRFLSSNKSMYLYNVDNVLNISVKDSINIGIKRLPVINLTGRISKSDFDSSKPYIYISRDGSSGLQLCNYTDLDSDLVFQVTDSSGSYKYRKLTKEIGFTIFCSATAPNEDYLCDKNDGNATDVYRLVCQPTEMNEEVQCTLTKL